MTLRESFDHRATEARRLVADYLEYVGSESEREIAMGEIGAAMMKFDFLHDVMTDIGEHELASDILSLRSELTHGQWTLRDKSL